MIWTQFVFLFSVHQVFMKKEGNDEENAINETEEIVLETVDPTSGHMLPVIIEEAETAVVEEIIQVRTTKFE